MSACTRALALAGWPRASECVLASYFPRSGISGARHTHPLSLCGLSLSIAPLSLKVLDLELDHAAAHVDDAAATATRRSRRQRPTPLLFCLETALLARALHSLSWHACQVSTSRSIPSRCCCRRRSHRTRIAAILGAVAATTATRSLVRTRARERPVLKREHRLAHQVSLFGRSARLA